MAYGVNVKFPYDLNKKAWEQSVLPYNRWHPEVPMVEEVKPGEPFSIEIADWTGGQIGDNDSANDVRDVEARTGSLSGRSFSGARRRTW